MTNNIVWGGTIARHAGQRMGSDTLADEVSTAGWALCAADHRARTHAGS